MKKVIFGVLIFTAGLGIGGGVGYLIAKKKEEARLTEELEKNQEYYIKLLGYSEPGERDIPQDLKEDAEDILSRADTESTIEHTNSEGKTFKYTSRVNSQKDEFLKNRSRIRYDKIPSPIQDEEVDDVSLTINNDNPENDICIITADQFARDHTDYEKNTLLWWPKNKLVTTEDYDILDVPDLIGTEWQDRIGEFEKDVVYVRNNGAQADYEICQQHDDYYDYSG